LPCLSVSGKRHEEQRRSRCLRTRGCSLAGMSGWSRWVLDRGMQRKAAHPTGSHACILLACAPGPAACLHECRTQGAVAARPAAATRVARAKRRGQACARARRAWLGRLAGNVRLWLLRGSRIMKGSDWGCRGPCQIPHGLPRVRVQLPHPLAGLHRVPARAGPQAGAPRSRRAAPAPPLRRDSAQIVLSAGALCAQRAHPRIDETPCGASSRL